jgi:hypothetical protein
MDWMYEKDFTRWSSILNTIWMGDMMMKNTKLWLMTVVFCSLFGLGTNVAFAVDAEVERFNCYQACAETLRLCMVGRVTELGNTLISCGGDSTCQLAEVRRVNENQICAQEHMRCVQLCSRRVELP